jgi:cytoskeletal protein RodZ
VLARLKYQRQTLRRSARRDRQRKLGIAAGVLVAIVAAFGLVWLIVHLAKDDSSSPTNPTPVPSLTLPTQSTGQTEPTSPAASTPTKSTPTKHKSKPTKSGAS